MDSVPLKTKGDLVLHAEEQVDRTIIIPCPAFQLQLAHWDSTFPPIHSKRILCFSLPEDVGKQRVIEYLHIALHYTVEQLPFLAGSIIPFSPEQGARPWLRNVSAHGSLKLIIRDLSRNFSFLQLAKSNFPQDLLSVDQLCPFPKVAYVQEEPVDACGVQANFVDGGLLLVWSVIHVISDGRAQWDILKVFAAELQKAQSGETSMPLKSTGSLYRLDRAALVSGHGVLGAIENHPAWTSSKVNAYSQIFDVDVSCRIFRISSSALSRLKKTALASTQDPEDWISTSDALSAFIWRSIMIARHRAGLLPHGSTTNIVQPVNCRSLLHLPEPYFGNAIYFTKASTLFEELMDTKHGLSSAARLIRAEIKGVTAEKFRDLVGYAELTKLETHTRLDIVEDMNRGGIILTNQYKFDISEYEFGTVFGGGHFQAFRYPAQGIMAGTVTILPRLKDGSCDFMLVEQDATFKSLVEDEFFGSFAKQ